MTCRCTGEYFICACMEVTITFFYYLWPVPCFFTQRLIPTPFLNFNFNIYIIKISCGKFHYVHTYVAKVDALSWLIVDSDLDNVQLLYVIVSGSICIVMVIIIIIHQLEGSAVFVHSSRNYLKFETTVF